MRKTAAAVVSGSSERDVVVSREPGLSVAPTASSMCTDAQRLQTLSRRHSQNEMHTQHTRPADSDERSELATDGGAED